MKNLYYFHDRGILFSAEFNDNHDIVSEEKYIAQREGIRGIYIIPEDTTLRYFDKKENISKTREVKKGQLLISFYENSFTNSFIIIDSKEWLENLNDYNKKCSETLSIGVNPKMDSYQYESK